MAFKPCVKISDFMSTYNGLFNVTIFILMPTLSGFRLVHICICLLFISDAADDKPFVDSDLRDLFN
mgnify:CR=1 FL=1